MKRPLATLEPFNPADALHVLSALDENDQLEAELMRGDQANPYDLLAGWMALEAQGAVCFIGGVLPPYDQPIAVLALVPSSTPGLGHAAMLARDHKFWKRAMVPLARIIRDRLPEEAHAMGLHRIEARSWAHHPTAPNLLRAIGFELEAEMVGFGHSGEIPFNQWVWLADYIPRPPQNNPTKET